MPRPRRFRWVSAQPGSTYFKPRGIPLAALGEVVLTVEEHEAIRLADLEGLHHEEAAERMKVSRPTFGRVVASARRKIADALVNGKAIRVEGGDFVMAGPQICVDCDATWDLSPGDVVPPVCPSCGGANSQPSGFRTGYGAGRGQRRGRCYGGGRR
jgi:predicted DNA-binding protein (UPF0251 family)